MENKRHPLPDILKGVAVVLMIQVHLTELFAVETWFRGLGGSISLFLGGPPAAPVFMALMGFYAGFIGKSSRLLFVRGAKLLLAGLLLNLGMNFHLLLKISQEALLLDPKPYIFGVDILILAGLSLWILAVFQKLFVHHQWLWLVLMLILGFSNPFLPVYNGDFIPLKYIQSALYGFSSWSYFPLFPWGAYVVAGYYSFGLLKKYEQFLLTERNKLWAFLALSLVLLLSFNFGFQYVVLLSAYYHHSGLSFLWNLAFVLWWILLFDFIVSGSKDNKLQKTAAWMGRNVTAMYVFQWLIIGNLATNLFKTQYPLQLLVWFIVVLFGASALTFLRLQGLTQIKKRGETLK